MSNIAKAATCPSCGAPEGDSRCSYCGTIFQNSLRPQARTRGGTPEGTPGLFPIRVGALTYSVLGRLARGENSEVLLARRAGSVAEQVVLKVGSHRLGREYDTLRHLQGRNSYLDRLLPQPLALARVRGRTVLVMRWRSGFVDTLAQVREQYPDGVDPRGAVWIWSRILDTVACLSDLGYSHGGLSLEHLLVHPRDHGIAFCGWGKARLGAGDDLAAGARCVSELLSPAAPEALLKLTRGARRYSSPRHLQSELKKVALDLFGPPSYQPFALPRAVRTEVQHGIR